MSSSPLKQAMDGSVLRVTLARPDRHNAFDEGLVAALSLATQTAADNEDVRILLLDGEGPSFCAGADVAWMRELGERGEKENRASARCMANLFHLLDRLPKPLVGRVHGACIGGGLGLAAVCDVVICESGTRFSAREVRLGILPAVVGPYVIRKIGASHCRELFLTGRRFTAEEALRLGLVHRVVAAEDLDATVNNVVEDLLKGGPAAQTAIKELLVELRRGGRRGEELMKWTAGRLAKVSASEEGIEGLRAFLDKRPPSWQARTPEIDRRLAEEQRSGGAEEHGRKKERNQERTHA